MTTIQASLHVIVQRVRALLECADVILSLASPSEADHPLLALLSVTEETDVVSLFIQNENYKSSVIVPLVRPGGLLGFLVCVDTQPNRFMQGECALLEQVVPTLAREVEDILSDAVITVSQEKRKRHIHMVVPEQQTLVSLVGHDLRMPLTAIKGYAGLLQAYGPTHTDMTPELQRHYLDVIMEQTQHMEVLVNDLLDVSRIQSGQLALHCTWVNIVFLCQRVIRVVQDRCEQQQPGKYTLRCCFDTTSELIWADPDRVRQVLMNLLENAVKYSPDGGSIEIRVRNSAMRSSITVRDWGLGIPQPQQDALFHAFQRGERLEQQRIAGLGLGLYIVRTLVEAMDGSITLRSSKGNGTSVSFTLPTVHDKVVIHRREGSMTGAEHLSTTIHGLAWRNRIMRSV